MNPFEFVLTVLGMVFLFTLMKQRMRVRHRWEHPEVDADAGVETRQLRDEVRQLKDRIQVLERIAVEKEDTLSRQIEELRHR
ncbi:hypothetical protein HMF7854_07740 [Sphingomonas ginkgonis]|uniref:Phage shock protein B n=1 Tax=Sphingomonas ginkgonis TaxID=2315330 RepID=A0A429V9Z1_9SPHN|nr:hypothetical protein [Sphingomonas ginkgonis]RST30735.1 hypothetical protein HMF7854_07740 [Sphingomonas ginkgonis]